MSLITLRLIKQFYPETNRPIFKSIRINGTTRIVEMIAGNQKKILVYRNRHQEGRVYHTKTSCYTRTAYCPMKYTQVLCHACFGEIKVRDLYVSKNRQGGLSKFYHISCAVDKLIICLDPL